MAAIAVKQGVLSQFNILLKIDINERGARFSNDDSIISMMSRRLQECIDCLRLSDSQNNFAA